MSANDIQVGGGHYKKMVYQHWDFGCDLNLHGLIWNASKYVSRWRDKAGVQDLRKAIHFLEKAIERNILTPYYKTGQPELVEQYCDQLDKLEAAAVTQMVGGYYSDAIVTIRRLIASEPVTSG